MSWLPLLYALAVGSSETGQAAVTPAPTQLEDIQVLGRRGRARVDPEVEIGAAGIDALGAYDIGDVIRRTTEDYALGDAPIVLVNGRRMADPGVFSGFPSDALVRVEVLPPEAGGVYGAADPSQRVVNIVLQRHFRSRDGRGSLRRPTAGDRSEVSLDLRESSIADLATRNLTLQVTRDTALRAGERDLSRTSEVTTLRPETQGVAAGLALTAAIADWSASLNADTRRQESVSVSLRDGETVENRRRSRSLTATGGLNGELAGWSTRLSVSGLLSEADHTGLSQSGSYQRSVSANLGLNRVLLVLPAGSVTANLSAAASRSYSVIDGAEMRRTFQGRTEGLTGGLSIPIVQSGTAGLPGDLTMTLGADLTETDAGQGEGRKLALAWSPWSRLRLNSSWSTSTQSLSDHQRFEPEYFGEPTVVFDFRTGEAVTVLPILGGNPDLRPPRSDQFTLSVSAGPVTAWSLQGGVNLQRLEAIDGVGVFPHPTPDIEAAFPERFQRDAEGRLTSIDRRPINFASASTETLTTNLSAAFPMGRSGDAAGRLRMTLNHSWQLTNLTTIREDLPSMNRLAGDGGGGAGRQANLLIDARWGAWGVNLAGRWRDGHRIRRDSGRDGPDDVMVRPFSTVDLKIGYRFTRDVASMGDGASARRGVGLQLDCEVSNLLDARPDARLGDGRPAPGYGRDEQDPLGRTLRFVITRRF